MRNLVLILGDQLDRKSTAFEGFDRARDAVWMAEVADESERTWSTKPRIAMFLTAMRHFAQALEKDGYRVLYYELLAGTLSEALARTLQSEKPNRLIVVKPGEWGVLAALQAAAAAANVPLDIRADTHFLCSDDEFAAHAANRKQLRMEYFYRELRERTGVLMTRAGKPVGDQWNFDTENRKSFGKQGPGMLPSPVSFQPDALTTKTLDLVRTRFQSHAGSVDHFDFAVTREQALVALQDFIDFRLPTFGAYQDAMWTNEPYLYHSRLSAAMNLKLLNPREVIESAEQAYQNRKAPLASVEGFIRQILGWREYVRGIYWHLMPTYLERNELNAQLPLPAFYWNAETDMNCLRDTIAQTLKYGYAHHIQRLMVTGLFALLFGVHPKKVHEWYIAVYVDAVEWVELPNTLGMSQYGDGGVMGSKPYAASGRYIDRMSNYCAGCRYDPTKSTGENACPFTTLYWDFLRRHERKLRTNQRMTMMLKNLDRLSREDQQGIAAQAESLRLRLL